MKKTVLTENAPAPIGPYSQAVVANGMVYVSGQVAIDPATGEVKTDDLEEETHLVMKNLKAVLAASGSSLDQVIKCSIFISDMGNFSRINEVYGSYFTGDFPARETVEVSCLPKNVNVEISCMALVG
ncbi:RidA family protein [bacterium SCSIO 12741]|nr:RidA family protein [bacterium SCSIO 12741]